MLRSLVVSLTPAFLLLTAVTAFGGSATWNLNPTNGEWENPSNWTPATVPNGPADTATFGVSNITGIYFGFSFEDEVNGIVFEAGASAFTIIVESFTSFDYVLTISGQGITNNSGVTQYFVAEDDVGGGTNGVIQFTNSATAGDLTVFTVDPPPATAQTAEIVFLDTSTAGSATLIANEAGGTYFGGLIKLADDSNGGTARVEVFGNGAGDVTDGTLDISGHNAPGVTVGSIEGNGLVSLGNNNLTLGSNDLDTTFSGVIEDSGAGGSITKAGGGRLILTGANTYTGATTIRGGLVEVRNEVGSGTGSGRVQVAGGQFGGTGIIAGPVTVGTRRGRTEAILSPGQNAGKPGTLTLLNTLTFTGNGKYRVYVNSDAATMNQVIANGVTIGDRDRLNFLDSGQGVLQSSELYDSGDGTWAATDSLITPRAGHTATLLPDGKVLVVGGTRAELYDPASRTWTATGSLAFSRIYHTATLLLNGKVLVAGNTTTAELYDPAGGVWTATGNMNTARTLHTAALLLDGNVLVAGGVGLDGAELYNPATGTWVTTGSLTIPRWQHTMTLLPNGKVLVVGGVSGFNTEKSAELYDSATGTWTTTGSLHTARFSHTATLLPNGKVLAAGGFGSGRSAELYDPASGTWTATSGLAIPRAYHAATLLPNGKVLAAGGNNGINFMEPSAELYDPESGTWTTTGSLSYGRFYHTATLLPDGQVLVTGGEGIGLQIGTVLTVIDNTATTQIAGTFANLPDGATAPLYRPNGTFVCNLEVSYKGGDGNDLTLTVVP